MSKTGEYPKVLARFVFDQQNPERERRVFISNVSRMDQSLTLRVLFGSSRLLLL
jgi:hypothetical protein